jgi:hypothetical protein
VKTIEERKAILDKDIFRHVNHGWRVSSRSETKCLMVREKKQKDAFLFFSCYFS